VSATIRNSDNITEKAMKENNTTNDSDNTAIAWKYINELDINKRRLLINTLCLQSHGGVTKLFIAIPVNISHTLYILNNKPTYKVS
jgi:hypothetical protein